MRDITRKFEDRIPVPPNIDSLAENPFVLLSHPNPQPTTKGEPGTISSFYLGRYSKPKPRIPYSTPREIEGYFIDVHSSGIEVTPFDGPNKLSAEQRKRVIDEFTRQLRTTSEGHAIMRRLTDEQLIALNIETILHSSYKH